LAEFFAAKLRCAVIWQVFTITGDARAAEKAIDLYTKGRDNWVKMAERAKTIYRSDISYGPSGHWIDRISSFDEDIADMKIQLNVPKTMIGGQKEKVDAALQYVSSAPTRPQLEVIHKPSKNFIPGKTLHVNLKVIGNPRNISMYYRHVNQSQFWQAIELNGSSGNYEGEIPANFTSNRFPLQYYFEIETDTDRATLFPTLGKSLTEVPYYVVHRLP
ncbi:MAG: hypothetical protein ACFCUU_07540, partial [Cyclobacteriaceae bacterium]